MFAEPLTPEEEREWRRDAAWHLHERLWATLDAAREWGNICDNTAKGLLKEVQIAVRERDEARAEVERLKAQNKSLWNDNVNLGPLRGEVERMRPVVEAAMEVKDNGALAAALFRIADNAATLSVMKLVRAVETYRAQEEVMPNARSDQHELPVRHLPERGQHAVTGAAHPSPRDEPDPSQGGPIYREGK